jgi:uncharacterized membrane-anchored protein
MTHDASLPTRVWRFWLPLLFQVVLILAVPAQAVYTRLTGRTVILQTVPVDPYELLRGYFQTLRYDISLQENLRKLPGWKELPKQSANDKEPSFIQTGTRVYVILQAPKPRKSSTQTPTSKLPRAWKPVAISTELPSQLPENRVALSGIAQHGFIEYGLETYYIPEDQREQINDDLRAARSDESTESPQLLQPTSPISERRKPPVRMEIKVDDRGESVPISLWARMGKGSKQRVRNYQF